MNNQPITISLVLPAMTLEAYAELQHESIRSVRIQADKGLLPILQTVKGGKRYVNMVAMLKTCDEAATWNVQAPSKAYSL